MAESANGSGWRCSRNLPRSWGRTGCCTAAWGCAFVVSVPSSDDVPPTGGLRFSAPADKIHLFDLEGAEPQMRLLIAGWQGQVARALVELAPSAADVEAFAVGRPGLDLCNAATIKRAMTDFRPM